MTIVAAGRQRPAPSGRPADAARRRSFSFLAGGAAAWLTDADGPWSVEVSSGGGRERIGHALGLPATTQVSHPAAGLVGLCVPAFELVVLRHQGGWVAERCWAEQAESAALVPSFPGARWQLVISRDAATSWVWRTDWAAGATDLVTRLAGVATGGAWLGPGRLALNLQGDGEGGSGHLLDLATAECRPVFTVRPGSDDRIVTAHAGGRVAVTSDAFGYRRAGLATLGGSVRFLPDLPEGEESGEPSTFTAGGDGLVLRHQAGVRTRLLLVDADTLGTEALPVPYGFVGFPVVADGNRLRFPFSAPDLPLVAAGLSLPRRRFELDEPAAPAGVPAAPWSFPGPEGPVEALVHGDPAAGPVAIALHGGPIAQWSAGFNPECQLLAWLGFAVVAVNYPGSTGYGAAFTRRLLGRSGEVDVGSVTAVLEAVGAARRPAVLYGESYGAHLALRVAAARPELCAAVVAVSAFGSLPRLAAAGGPGVAALVGMLTGSGSPPPAGAAGAGPSWPFATPRCPVLLVHGDADAVVPPAEARALLAALAPHAPVRLVELPGQGHDIDGRAATRRLHDEVERFLHQIPIHDGRALGRRPCHPDKQATTTTPFAPGKEVLSDE